MSFLGRFAPRRDFVLPQFKLALLTFEAEGADPDSLLLDEVVACIGALPDPAAPSALAPTAGELLQSIELHLRSAKSRGAREDSVDELRNVLAQLRRSVG